MIRPMRQQDLPAVLTLWLESTTRAHPFIPPAYWQESLPSVRDDYLPAARTWVAERESALAGFISVLCDKVVGALFVALAPQAYPPLTLEVYRRNRHACRFYHRCGFIPIAQRLNAETGHLILTLHWRAGGIMHSSTPPPP
ncbi:N-acetyltransferase [Sodalis sp. (in: enterobacteria)]|uniref:N-acetyltransferase n=1 Tax=Sodalis sp. (in: enterobacteria) TaxID=1898979 RepID=UPI003F2D7894